jgi:spore germination protein GerM
VRLPVCAVLVLSCIAFVACGGGETEAPPGEAAAEAGPVEDDQTTDIAEEEGVDDDPTEPLSRHTVEVYFPSTQGNGLVGEYREIFETVTPGDRAKQIIADLISGPTGDAALRAVPSGTLLRQAYVLDNGVAYLDFTGDLADGIGGGSMQELLTIYAIIDSVALNVDEIKRIGILIEGEPVETLNGHVDLRRPLPPDRSLILEPTVVRNDPTATGERA